MSGLHALNNAMQDTTFNREELDSIANELNKDFDYLSDEYPIEVVQSALKRKNVPCQTLSKDQIKNFPDTTEKSN